MNLFIAVTIVVSVSALAIVQSVRNFRYDDLADARSRHLSRILAAGVALIVSDIILGGDYLHRLVADLSVVLLSVLLLNFSIRPRKPVCEQILKVVIGFEILLTAYYLICKCGFLPLAGEDVFILAAGCVSLVSLSVFLMLVGIRVYDIKSLLKAGTVWSYLNLCVDVVYVLTQFVTVSSVVVLCRIFPEGGHHITAAVAVLAASVLASGARITFDSAFVLLHKHERVIVESMKISQGEVSAHNAKMDELYKDIYERIVLHFEMKKPFLDSELTINDVVKVVYSNKVYISRAICHYTGRNFRQFVNYHRVIYSMDAFRRQPALKVTELAGMSGFNSVVSYTSAFRLFMNETPSEWCRKEKTRILKTKI